jgi:MerR family transcriptional regulator, heat shock protein HspR
MHQMESNNTNDELLNEPVYSIGLAAEKLNIAVPTLRMYEKAGLLIPYKTKTGRRIYSRNDLSRVQVIIELIRVHKLNLEAIKAICSLTPCWNIVDCPKDVRESCSVYNNGKTPCWLSPDRNCAMKGIEDCRECDVYLACPKMLKNPKQYFKENY